MSVPEFIKTKFNVGTLVSVWFRRGIKNGGMVGRVSGWEHVDGVEPYFLFETLAGDVLYLAFADIHLSTLSEEDYTAAKAEHALSKRAKALKHKVAEAQLEEMERTGGRIEQPPSIAAPGGRRFM